MSEKKTLTILIPVYNGAKHIGGLLGSFATFLETSPAGQQFLTDCEILVVNNRSEDATLSIAQSFTQRIPNLRIVSPEEHMPSAEQNVFRAFHLANGEFTWVLGVDEVVRFQAFPDVLKVARDNKYDIAVFNFMVCDESGCVETVSNFFMQDRFEGDLVRLTQRVGYWWLIAGFSGQIIRTSRVVGYDHATLVKNTCSIYSHVTAYMECMAGQPAAIINIPNVIYRVARNDPAYWPRIARRLNVFDEFFWTLGFVRQIAYLESKGIVGRDYLVKMIDTNQKDFFRPTVLIYEKIVSQLQIMRSAREPRNRVSREQFEELVGYFEQRDPLARPFLSLVRQVYDSLEANKRIGSNLDEARDALLGYQSNFLLIANFCSLHGDYEIYHLAGTYYAVHRLFHGALMERIRYLENSEYAPVVLEAPTLPEIIQRINESGIGMALDRVPASAMRYCSQVLTPGLQSWSPGNLGFGKKDGAQCVLAAAQAKLREAYKTDRRMAVRFATWVAARSLKIARKLLGSGPKK